LYGAGQDDFHEHAELTAICKEVAPGCFAVNEAEIQITKPKIKNTGRLRIPQTVGY
jgi:hypothetical protein